MPARRRPRSPMTSSAGRGQDRRPRGHRRHRRLQGGRGVSPPGRRRRPRRPRPHRRRHAVRGRGHLLGPGVGAGADESLWSEADPIPHTHLGQRADLVLVAPATARFLGCYANGHLRRAAHRHGARHACAGDGVSRPCTPRCGSTPPSRTTWPRCAGAAVHVVEPGEGRLAGGDVGAGRLAEPVDIVDAALAVLGRDLSGTRPRRAARRGERGRHAGADRPGALHLQPVVGEAGPRRGRSGRGTRCATSSS